MKVTHLSMDRTVGGDKEVTVGTRVPVLSGIVSRHPLSHPPRTRDYDSFPNLEV